MRSLIMETVGMALIAVLCVNNQCGQKKVFFCVLIDFLPETIEPVQYNV